ncbi:TMEM175 family protein [Croceitalea rosinachiae]|uniref:TMEM175 family protein n=1 Tax=Croceitalea rosinachiae TaxID=3075596 RepID=A0ABU3ADG3_9FLAO|nr:TMEM175 family protein [Croceitalea sp. F388]MDT0607153.1 TMEM175 family protein [Croceitalea sp. F388]
MKFPHNISRIEAFSDAVFAFAATLLVVSVGSEVDTSVLNIDWMVFLSFGVSFFVLVALWSLHYNFFRRTDYIDNWIIAINAILLFVVLYYVFPLKSLINSWTGGLALNSDDFSSLFQLYSLGFVLIFLCLTLMYFRAYTKTKKLENSIILLFYVRHFSIYVFVSLLSILIAKLKVGLNFALPGIIYALLGPLCYIHGVHFEKKYNRTT